MILQSGKARAVACVAGLLLAPTSVRAQPGVETSVGEARASIVQPISVIAEKDLDFGAVNSRHSAPLVVQPMAGASASGASAAKFRVRGEPLRSYQVQVEGRVAAIGKSTGFEVPVIDLTASSSNTGAHDWSGKLDGLGNDTVYVGGSLTLPNDAPSDRYTADVRVIVQYQ